MRKFNSWLDRYGFASVSGAAYGGVELIELFELFDDHLKLRVNSKTAKLLGADSELLVKFDPCLESLTQIAELLKVMVGSVFVDRRK